MELTDILDIYNFHIPPKAKTNSKFPPERILYMNFALYSKSLLNDS